MDTRPLIYASVSLSLSPILSFLKRARWICDPGTARNSRKDSRSARSSSFSWLWVIYGRGRTGGGGSLPLVRALYRYLSLLPLANSPSLLLPDRCTVSWFLLTMFILIFVPIAV